MKFTNGQILSAINDPFYKDGTPGMPIGYSVIAFAQVGTDQPYIFVRPAKNVVLEVRAFLPSSANIEAWYLVRWSDRLFNLTAPVPAAADAPLLRIQDPNLNSPARSTMSIGSSIITTAAIPPVLIAKGKMINNATVPLYTFPNPVVLFGDASNDPPLCGIVGSGFAAEIDGTLFCREWPYDTDNY